MFTSLLWKMYRTASLVTGIVLFLAIQASNAADYSGRYGAEFMAAGGGARSLAIGGAYTAQAGDPFVLFWNPAGLYGVDRYTAGFQHSERFDGIVDYDVAVVAGPGRDHSVWSLGLIRLGVNGVPFTDLENRDQPPSESNRIIVDKMVNEADYALFAGRTAVYKERWRWGIAPKLIFKHFGTEHQAYGLGVDVGGSTQLFQRIPTDIAVSVHDLLGTVLVWDTGRKEIIAPSARFGGMATITIPPLDAVVNPSADIVYRFENLGDPDAVSYYYGLEYLIKEVVGLRIGSNDGEPTFGGGITIQPVSVDYAFIGHTDLDLTHRVSITVKWGKPK